MVKQLACELEVPVFECHYNDYGIFQTNTLGKVIEPPNSPTLWFKWYPNTYSTSVVLKEFNFYQLIILTYIFYHKNWLKLIAKYMIQTEKYLIYKFIFKSSF